MNQALTFGAFAPQEQERLTRPRGKAPSKLTQVRISAPVHPLVLGKMVFPDSFVDSREETFQANRIPSPIGVMSADKWGLFNFSLYRGIHHARSTRRTWSACGPLSPFITSNSTVSPSLRLLYPSR